MSVRPSSSQIRAQLDHPIVDADGHFVEVMPLLPRLAPVDLDDPGATVFVFRGHPVDPQMRGLDQVVISRIDLGGGREQGHLAR